MKQLDEYEFGTVGTDEELEKVSLDLGLISRLPFSHHTDRLHLLGICQVYQY